jgi:exonuclease VII small subunit
MFEYLSRLDSARKYFEEGEALIDRDPVQAGEKLYKACEEAIKALAIYHGLRGGLG